MSHPIGDALWRWDGLLTETAGQATVLSWVTNLDYSWQWAGRNVYGFVEYFRNGFGVEEAAAADAELLQRIARGELYTLGRDTLALGLMLEAHPLVQLHLSLIGNLHDQSLRLPLALHYDWRDSTQLRLAFTRNWGASDSEYGAPTTAHSLLQLRLMQHF